MTTDVGEHRECAGGNYGAANGQAVEAVGKVHGIARADNDEHDKKHKGQKGQGPQVRIRGPFLNDKIRPELLEKWHQ
jgi:hypothetical protein